MEHSIHSMTGFFKQSMQTKSGQLDIEIRSVNHRYLDYRAKVAPSIRFLEAEIRELISKYCTRGRVELNLLFFPNMPTVHMEVQTHLLTSLIEQLERLDTSVLGNSSYSLDALLALPGMVEMRPLPADEDALRQDVLHALEEALIQWDAERAREGAFLQKDLQGKLNELSESIQIVRSFSAGAMEQEAKKRKARIEFLLECEFAQLKEIWMTLSEREVFDALLELAQRVDIDEETVRLEAHREAFAALLEKGGVIGKNLDFLIQEMNRELNTSASKSTDPDVRSRLVAMKGLVEQMREQIQNIE